MTPLAGLRARAPALCYGLLFLVAAELVAAVAAPLVVPDRVYLRSYLGRRSRETADLLLAGKDEFLLYDSLLGWRTRPNASHANWSIDSLGSRSAHPIALARTARERLLFIGSSLVNGGTAVTAGETISAYAEDRSTEALNFGTMLYALDQTYLAYASSLYRYRPDVVVVGLPEDPSEGLANRYVPFRLRSEHNLPFLKPRFVLQGGGLRLLPVPPRRAYADLLRSGDLLRELRASDGDYPAFSRYEHFGLTPLASALSALYVEARDLVRLVRPGAPSLDLALELMRRLRDEAAAHGAATVFVMLPGRPTAFPPAWRRRLPDAYARVVAEIRSRGFAVLDGRDVLRRSGRPAGELYRRDGIHFSALGNRLLAGALRPLVTRPPVAGAAPPRAGI